MDLSTRHRYPGMLKIPEWSSEQEEFTMARLLSTDSTPANQAKVLASWAAHRVYSPSTAAT
ncbi:MAG TPA: hypothetical protein VN363_01935 [Anaerolineales bacterium]|nr:hypothetical protein [Anaerolineales bacterium]